MIQLSIDEISGFIEGDKENFNRIFKYHYKTMVLFAHGLVKIKEEAEDIVTNVMMRLWEKRSSLHFKTEHNIKSFLFVSVRNECMTVIKRKGRTKERDAVLNIPIDSDENFLFKLIEADLISYIRILVNDLPEKEKKIFNLYYMEGKDTKEIAQELGMSDNTVRAYNSRALSAIRERINKETTIGILIIIILLLAR